MNYNIEVIHLSKSFNGKSVLKDINLCVTKGDIVTILGGSGSGKSVFLKTLIGLENRDSGDIFYNNQPVKTKSDYKNFYKEISVLFQNNALFDSMTIKENILFPFINDHKYSESEFNQLFEESIISVGLDPSIKDLYVSEISGGMQKRVALARAIITKPQIIFLDEPTSGLDVANSKLIFELVKTLSKKYGITLLIITHDVFLSPAISDKMLFLENGVFEMIDKEWLEKKFMMQN